MTTRLVRAGTLPTVRAIVLFHVFALFVVPKTIFQSGPLRPEDVTGSLLLVAFAWLLANGRLPIPDRSVAASVALYMAYFLVPLLLWDLARGGYVLAPIFWLKELSSVAFGYLVWWAYRDDVRRFLRPALIAMLPNLAYGVVQLMWRPAGLYGVAPFGHEASPASAGMLFFAYALVLLLSTLAWSGGAPFQVALVVSGILVVAAASKMALLGFVCFFGWYAVETVVQKRDARLLVSLGLYSAGLLAAIVVAVSIGVRTFAWRGLSRYEGFLQPLTVLVERGVWWKIAWVDTPVAVFFGAGYSPPHVAHGAAYSLGMAMDNQILYYLVTGGAFGLLMYLLLLAMIYATLPARLPQGRVLRALVVSYVAMGLGAEVMQLSIHGNVFWMIVGLAFAMDRPEQARGVAVVAPGDGDARRRPVTVTAHA